MKKPISFHIEKISNGFEVGIAILLLVVILLKVIEFALDMAGVHISIFDMPFEQILSVALGLVIGVEFVKMLCKHTSESVIDVLLFTLARQMVVYHETVWDILVGVAVIIGLFAAKRFLIEKKKENTKEKKEE
jgi:phosphotransferase system  glucose/maltose/N-acetylglucosamine-specific IIC component